METLTNLQNTANIVSDQGSPFANFALCTTSGETLVLDSNIASMPIIKSFNFKYSQETKSTEDAGGNIYYLSGGKKEGTLEVVAIQNDGATLKFAESYGNKTGSFVFEMNNVLVNGKSQQLIIPYAKISPNTEIVKPGQDVKLTLLPMPAPKAMTMNLPAFTCGFLNAQVSGATLSIPKSTVYTIFEA